MSLSFKEIFDKENERVKQSTREAQMAFFDEIEKSRNERGMKIGDVSESAAVGPSMMSRLSQPDANLTLKTMQRFAHAVGKKVVIGFEDLEGPGAETHKEI